MTKIGGVSTRAYFDESVLSRTRQYCVHVCVYAHVVDSAPINFNTTHIARKREYNQRNQSIATANFHKKLAFQQ